MAKKRKVARKAKRTKKVKVVRRGGAGLGLSEEERTTKLRKRDLTHSPGVSTSPRRKQGNPGDNYQRSAGKIRWE